MKQIKEIRSNEQIQAGSESRKIEGYGVVFNSESVDLGGFTEIISPNAITEETIRNSDILFLLDHNRERGVLARSKYGVGSLSVSVDERGVKYEFEAPKTALGDEVLEGLRRQDINKCSFAFTVAKDSWVKREDGSVLRTIEEIDKLYDLSVVWHEAYSETYVVNKRGLDELEEREAQEAEKDDEEKPDSEDEAKDEANCDSDEERSETPDNEEDETPAEDETGQDETEEREADPDESDEEDENTDEAPADDEEHTETEERNNNLYIKENHTNISNNMNKNKFSLLGAIRDVVNHRSFDEGTQALINEARNVANKAGIATNGQIILPVELRAEGDAPATPATKPVNGLMATENEIGKEVVPTDLWNVLEALRDRLVLTQAGAHFVTAQGNIEIPVYSGSSVFWSSEVGEAQDGSGKFSKVTLSPKRLTAFVDISKQLINQTNESIESMIRQDLINAVAEKIQRTLLGNEAEVPGERPAGIMKNVVADVAAFSYDDAVNMEAALEKNNTYGDFRYIVSPTSKAIMRTTPLDKGCGRFVYENNEILGIPAYSTCSAIEKSVLLGDFSQLVIANFGALDIVVDEISLAHKSQIRLVINFFVDWALKRENAVVKRILK